MHLFSKIAMIAILVLMCNWSFAHDPNEVYYSIVATKEKQQLTIHFTPLAASNLLYFLKPELKSDSELSLADYSSEFERYFNETIDLTIDQQDIQFELTAHELETHEATLTFALKNLQTYDSQFEISISSYLEVNDRIMNVVRVNLNGEKTGCILDKNSKTCSSTNKVTLADVLLVAVAIGVLLALLFFTRKRRNK